MFRRSPSGAFFFLPRHYSTVVWQPKNGDYPSSCDDLEAIQETRRSGLVRKPLDLDDQPTTTTITAAAVAAAGGEKKRRATPEQHLPRRYTEQVKLIAELQSLVPLVQRQKQELQALRNENHLLKLKLPSYKFPAGSNDAVAMEALKKQVLTLVRERFRMQKVLRGTLSTLTSPKN